MAKHERIATDDVTRTTTPTFSRLNRRMSREGARELIQALNASKLANSFEAKIREIEPELKKHASRSNAPPYGARATPS